MSRRERRDPHGAALLLFGALAVARACATSAPPPSVSDAGEAVVLDPCALAGDEFRLLPGVGPVLAGRLEDARRAAGGRLRREDLQDIPGIGPALLERWDRAPPD